MNQAVKENYKTTNQYIGFEQKTKKDARRHLLYRGVIFFGIRLTSAYCHAFDMTLIGAHKNPNFLDRNQYMSLRNQKDF